MSKLINITTASSAELLAFYNKFSGRETIKKFRDRKTAENRVALLLEEKQFKTPEPQAYNGTHCPKCGGTDFYEGRAGKNGCVVDEEHIIGCHACDWQIDYRGKKKAVVSTGKPRPAIQESLKLDRTIRCEETQEVWGNAYQMWKANPGYMTSSQQDRLTAQLYGAAKKGERLVVRINDLNFSLVNVTTA